LVDSLLVLGTYERALGPFVSLLESDVSAFQIDEFGNGVGHSLVVNRTR